MIFLLYLTIWLVTIAFMDAYDCIRDCLGFIKHFRLNKKTENALLLDFLRALRASFSSAKTGKPRESPTI
jgi:hypothetical protein